MLASLLCAAVLSTPCAPASHPWVAEVFYDAIGDDTGREFVELLNPGSVSRSLAGVRLEAGDGSAPGRWTLRWTGGARDSIAPGARFVIGGAAVVPRPDAEVTLDLQNGPDAIRLVWPDGLVEVVGYGAHEFAEYACGEPAPDAPAGQSLARVPDESNAGGNLLDFRPAAPSPGAPNLPGRNVAIAPGSLAIAPDHPAPGEALVLSGDVVNSGTESLAPGSVTAHAEASREGGVREPLGETTIAGGIAAGDRAAFTIEAFAPGAGKLRVVVAARAAGDQRPHDDADSILVRVGPGPLALSEVQFHPAWGEGEWVEARNASGSPLDLAGFALADRGGTTGRPEGGRAALPADSLAVLAQDRRALLLRFPGIDSTRVWETRPWPSLNNRDGVDGIADVVTLRELDGTPSDRHAYSGTGVPDGVPLERRDGDWWPARRVGGSPLAPPAPFAGPAGRFAIEPRVSGGGALRCRWSLPWPRARVRLELFDLAGREVPGGLPEFLAPGLGEREVRFAGLMPGVYAVALRARRDGGAEEITELIPIRLVGVAR